MSKRALSSSVLTVGLCWSAVAGAQNQTFEQFKVDRVYVGRNAEPILDSSDKRMYRTRLRWATKVMKPNFAGEYIITTWGCGSGCQHYALINARTGQVQMLPWTVTNGETLPGRPERAEFRAQSRLLVINGQIDELKDERDLYRYFVFDGKKEFHLAAVVNPKPTARIASDGKPVVMESAPIDVRPARQPEKVPVAPPGWNPPPPGFEPPPFASDLKQRKVTGPLPNMPEYVGTWSADLAACESDEHDTTPLRFSISKLNGYEHECKFESVVRNKNTWTMRSTCAEADEEWKSTMTVTVEENAMVVVDTPSDPRFRTPIRTLLRCPRDPS